MAARADSEGVISGSLPSTEYMSVIKPSSKSPDDMKWVWTCMTGLRWQESFWDKLLRIIIHFGVVEHDPCEMSVVRSIEIVLCTYHKFGTIVVFLGMNMPR
jgi:hypothetical protein